MCAVCYVLYIYILVKSSGECTSIIYIYATQICLVSPWTRFVGCPDNHSALHSHSYTRTLSMSSGAINLT